MEVTNQEKLSFSTNSGKTRKNGRSRFFLCKLNLFCFLFVCIFCCYYFCSIIAGSVTRFASGQPSGTEGGDDDDDIVLSFLKTPRGRSRVSSLSTSFSAKAIRFDLVSSVVSKNFFLKFFPNFGIVRADDNDLLGGTPVKMTSAQVMNLGRHIASEV